MNRVNVTMATDENYIVPTYIALWSMAESALTTTLYYVYILCPSEISDFSKEMIFSLREKFQCLEINIIFMNNLFRNRNMKIEHISYVTYYRLKLPSLLPDIEKCIYLDSDIIVNSDLYELYKVDLSDDYIAGVLSEGIHLHKYYSRTHCEMTGLKDIDTYVNAGVLVFNLSKIRKDGIEEKFIDASKLDYPAQDQDVLNIVCYGKIKRLPLYYNTMTKTNAITGKRKTIYPNDEIKKARNNPVIIHYSEREKAWHNPNSTMANYWWRIYEEVINKEYKVALERFVESSSLKPVPVSKIAKKEMIKVAQMIGIYGWLKRRKK